MPLTKRHTAWTPAEDVTLLDCCNLGLSKTDTARELNVAHHRGTPVRNENAVSNRRTVLGYKVAKIPKERVSPTQPPLPDVDPVEREQARRERLAGLREEREALGAIAGERSLRAKLEALAASVAQTYPPLPPYKPPVVRGAKPSVETMVQMWSDWHAGENVSREGMRGLNEYNDATFKARLQRVLETHLSIKQRLEAGGGWRFESCVIGANGDFVSGTIHELEKHSDHPNIVACVYDTGMALGGAIRDLAAHYPSVEVFCTSGNHGRFPDARKVQQKEPTRSWDTLVYLFARESVKDIPRVTFHIPDSYSVAFDIYRWRFLQTHGHDVKSWGGIPWYGLNRLVSNINALEANRGSLIHHYLFAHHHSATSLPHASGESFVNGSLIGANEWVLNALGKNDRPTQVMFQVHPEHGVTGRWPLFARDA